MWPFDRGRIKRTMGSWPVWTLSGLIVRQRMRRLMDPCCCPSTDDGNNKRDGCKSGACQSRRGHVYHVDYRLAWSRLAGFPASLATLVDPAEILGWVMSLSDRCPHPVQPIGCLIKSWSLSIFTGLSQPSQKRNEERKRPTDGFQEEMVHERGGSGFKRFIGWDSRKVNQIRFTLFHPLGNERNPELTRSVSLPVHVQLSFDLQKIGTGSKWRRSMKRTKGFQQDDRSDVNKKGENACVKGSLKSIQLTSIDRSLFVLVRTWHSSSRWLARNPYFQWTLFTSDEFMFFLERNLLGWFLCCVSLDFHNILQVSKRESSKRPLKYSSTSRVMMFYFRRPVAVVQVEIKGFHFPLHPQKQNVFFLKKKKYIAWKSKIV